MIRLLNCVTAAALVLASPVCAVGPVFVDLDAPGALASLEHDQPAQFPKVLAILNDAQRLPQARVPDWLRTAYHADSVRFDQMLLVSYPPRRKLSFSLDKVTYRATVVVQLTPARIVPAN